MIVDCELKRKGSYIHSYYNEENRFIDIKQIVTDTKENLVLTTPEEGSLDESIINNICDNFVD